MTIVRPLLAALALTGCSSDQQLAAEEGPTPSITLESPRAGDFLPVGSAYVTGTVVGMEKVEVNGNHASTRPEGDFVGEVDLVRGVNLVEARGYEANGDQWYVKHGVLAGDFGDPGDPIEDAMGLRVNQGGLDAISDFVAAKLDDEMVNELLAGMNPIYEDSYGVWGWDFVEIAASVDGVYWDEPSVSIVPSGADELTLTVSIPNLWVDLSAYGEAAGLDFDVSADLWATSADLEAVISVGADRGELDIDLTDAELSLPGFGYNTSLLPGDVEKYLFVDTIRGVLEGRISETIEEMVPGLLDEKLAGLDPSFETELMGMNVSVAAEFADLSVDPDGIELVVDMDVDIASGGDKLYAGYLLAGGSLPSADRDADMGAVISDDLLNRVLFEAWRAGALDMSLSSAEGTLPSMVLTGLKASEGSIDITAGLPPIITTDADGKLQAQISELVLDIRTPGGEFGDHMTAAVTVFVDLDMTIRDGVLVPEIGDLTVDLVVRDNDWGAASNEAVTNVLMAVLPLDSVTVLLADLAFPLPALSDFSIAAGDLDRVGNGYYTGIGIDLY